MLLNGIIKVPIGGIMQSNNFNLRGIPPEVMIYLKNEAKNKQTSVNSLLLKIIEQSIGFGRQSKKTRYHELDKLAGTWTEDEGKSFEEKMKVFETIDKELWS